MNEGCTCSSKLWTNLSTLNHSEVNVFWKNFLLKKYEIPYLYRRKWNIEGFLLIKQISSCQRLEHNSYNIQINCISPQSLLINEKTLLFWNFVFITHSLTHIDKYCMYMYEHWNNPSFTSYMYNILSLKSNML